MRGGHAKSEPHEQRGERYDGPKAMMRAVD